MTRFLIPLAAAALALAFAAGASAHDFAAGDLVIDHPWATPSIPGQGQAAAYLSIRNDGAEADRLVSARSPSAGAVMIHGQETTDDGVSRMVPLEAVDLAPAASAVFEPGGAHLMLIGLVEPLARGDSVPLTLEFEHAGTVEVTLVVETLADYLRAQSNVDAAVEAGEAADHAHH